MKKIISGAIIALLVFSVPCKAQVSSATVMMEATTGTILFGENENVRLPMASVTKIMTALVVIENCNLSETVIVNDEAAGVEGSSMYLRVGQQITVMDLLYGLMLSSGNDAATALAIHSAGSVHEFVKQMNRKAKDLGLMNTQFMNPSGLNDNDHYSSAYDLAVLTAQALKNKVFQEIVRTKTKTVDGKTLTNHNKLLWSLDGCIGVKTGFTKASGRCLVSAVERNGVLLICVTLNCSDDWNVHKKMYEEQFPRCKNQILLEEKTVYYPLAVAGGYSVGCYNKEIKGVVVDGSDQIEYVTTLPQFIYSNKKRGDVVGKLLVYSQGTLLAESDLILDRDPKLIKVELSFFEKLLQFILQLFGF